MPVAAIDIGTHSALLLIAELHNHQVMPLQDVATTTKLGAGLTDTGGISPAGLERLLTVLEDYRSRLACYSIDQITIFGTAALRQASNAQDCIQRIQQQLGWPVRVLSGEEEAYYSFRAMQSWGASPDPVVAVDIGGGSTEISIGDRDGIRQQWSLPIGAVQLKEQFSPPDPLSVVVASAMDDAVRQQLQGISPPPSPHQIVVTGGTVTTLASLMLELPEYRGESIDGLVCSLSQLEMLYRELNQLTLSQRQDLVGMEPGRADVILPAMRILLTLVRHLQGRAITITVRGVRYGILMADDTLLPKN